MSASLARTQTIEFDLGLPAPSQTKQVRPRAKRAAKPKRHLWIQPVLSEAMLAVGEFHTAFNLPLHVVPQDEIPADLARLRVNLLEEEVGEFKEAVADGNLVAIADALGDIAYVLYGTALSYGIDLDAVIAEIHRSNMSKLGPDGKPILREDGKVLKPDTFTKPDLERVLRDQPPLPFRPTTRGA